MLLTDRGPWAQADRALNCNVQPSTFGVALAALDLLAARAPDDGGRAAPAGARRADAGLPRCSTRSTAASGSSERLELRAAALLLAVECCTALLTARGGQGMDLAEPAQRLLRAAAFQVVHSQAAHVRAATLDALVA